MLKRFALISTLVLFALACGDDDSSDSNASNNANASNSANSSNNANATNNNNATNNSNATNNTNGASLEDLCAQFCGNLETVCPEFAQDIFGQDGTVMTCTDDCAAETDTSLEFMQCQVDATDCDGLIACKDMF